MSSYHSIVLRDIRTLSPADLQEKYDIEIAEDGKVHDRVENQSFDSLALWAAWLAWLEAADAAEYEESASKQGWNDED